MASDADVPNPKLLELSELLVGTWRVDGPDISGRAEYRTRNEGRLLVAYVDFSVGSFARTSASRGSVSNHFPL